MDRWENIAQTYTEAPWRKQLQFIGLFILILVSIGLIAGVYLNISARTAAAGREIQTIKQQIEDVDRDIEDFRSKLAYVTAAEEMEKRALGIGFRPVDSEELIYLKAPGYLDQEPIILAPYSGRSIVGAYALPHEYTESLFSWLSRQTINFTIDFLEGGP